MVSRWSTDTHMSISFPPIIKFYHEVNLVKLMVCYLDFLLLHEQAPCLCVAMSKSQVAPTTYCPERHLAVGTWVSGFHGDFIANPNPAIRRRAKQQIFGVVVSACSTNK